MVYYATIDESNNGHVVLQLHAYLRQSLCHKVPQIRLALAQQSHREQVSCLEMPKGRKPAKLLENGGWRPGVEGRTCLVRAGFSHFQGVPDHQYISRLPNSWTTAIPRHRFRERPGAVESPQPGVPTKTTRDDTQARRRTPTCLYRGVACVACSALVVNRGHTQTEELA